MIFRFPPCNLLISFYTYTSRYKFHFVVYILFSLVSFIFLMFIYLRLDIVYSDAHVLIRMYNILLGFRFFIFSFIFFVRRQSEYGSAMEYEMVQQDLLYAQL